MDVFERRVSRSSTSRLLGLPEEAPESVKVDIYLSKVFFMYDFLGLLVTW